MSESRSARLTGRTVVALVSLLVFGITGLGWSQVHRLTTGLSTADVLDPGAASTGEQNILLVGLDTRTDAQGNPLPADLLDQLHAGDSSDGGDNTDTMILIHIPAGGGNAVAFSIPRDSYVQIAGGYGKHKINSAYTYAQVAAENSLRAQGVSGAQLNVQAAQAGAKNAIQTVEQLTGLTVNHFASVNLVGFYDVSEAVGGVPVCLNTAVHDSYSGANFPAGEQTISGAQALAFVRQRHGLPNGDLDRIRRQQAFMASMAHTVLSAGTLTDPAKLGNLIGAVQKTVTIDQGWDVFSFAQQLQGLAGGKIRFETIPVGNVDLKTSDGDSVQVDPAQVKAFIQQAIGGSQSTVVPTVPSATATGEAVVDVENASGVDNLAARVSQDLSGLGYAVGAVSSVSSRHTTVVDYAAGEQTEAEQVAQFLGGVRIVADPALHAGHVRVYLGTDYSGPGAAPTTPATPTPAAAPITAGGVNCVN
ncbi:LCP family protein required for cell wall assembly [Amycolatopsis bartoniae]|uniref:LytTR family transcriptional regulator n=1 Tax=Amycolatopsis bartoniae TaxID=941986 RepID=A0A8H9MEP7_9PSEU|nr:LCP family protein [Amycolatopsis bartoniae]MBB2936034.1 LCP family protein required for cell wall assembly [Amycolatopsis bartoniae]TVT00888.1 LytR family transcriptional regulator [Amycolatopsis bartoniae]GHF63654.1 LytTR family transcriptional regulator [Amycolatopsis bartoniae]